MTPRLAPPARRPAPRLGSGLRRAFTLVELLVVITIIAVLTTIVAVASVGFIGSAREAATRTTIEKVDEAIFERVSSINRWHQRPVNRLEHDWRYRGWETRWYAKGLQIFANTPSAREAKLVLSRKGMMLELFPLTVDELKLCYWFWGRFDVDGVINMVPLPAPNSDVFVPYLSAAEIVEMNKFLADMDPDMPGEQTLDTPGEIFYYALLNAPVYGGQRVTEEEFKPSELVDVAWTRPDGTVSPPDGVFEIGDAWGNPLRFYRWPTRLVNNYPDASSPSWTDPTWGAEAARKTLMPNAPASAIDLKVDPDDRAGYLNVINPIWRGGAPKDFASIVMAFHDPTTWHAPLVVSAGADGKLGLDAPDKTYPFPPVPDPVPPVRVGLAAPIVGEEEMLFDNITNHSGRAGGASQ